MTVWAKSVPTQGGDRQGIDGCRGELGRTGRERRENQHGGDVGTRVRDGLEPAVLGPAALDEVRDQADRAGGRDQPRHVGKRERAAAWARSRAAPARRSPCRTRTAPATPRRGRQQADDEQWADLALRRNEHRNEDEGDAVHERKCSDNRALAGVHRPRATLARFSDELIGQQHYWASSAYSALARARAWAMHMFGVQSSISPARSARNWTEIAAKGGRATGFARARQSALLDRADPADVLHDPRPVSEKGQTPSAGRPPRLQRP